MYSRARLGGYANKGMNMRCAPPAGKSVGSLAAAQRGLLYGHQVDLRHVRDNFGHASLTTTSIYLHVDEDRRHQETDEKHRIDW